MDSATISVVTYVGAVVALTVLIAAVMLSRRFLGRSATGMRHRSDSAGSLPELVTELRRMNDLLEQRVADQDARLARLEARLPKDGGDD